MPRSTAAYLADVVDACDAISEVLAGVDLATYRERRPVRSAVEREFTVIGEAIAALGRRDSGLASRISHGRLIVGFRNLELELTRFGGHPRIGDAQSPEGSPDAKDPSTICA
jgi:uncharacterized protein with HEPN domain